MLAKQRVFVHVLRVQVWGGSAAGKCPDRGKLPARQEVPERGRFYVLFASTKRTKSSRRAAALSTPGDGSKLYQLCFFVTFPAFVPKPVCGATHFFSDVLNRCKRVSVVQTQDRCFPKMGCRTASLQKQAAFEKGSCTLSLLRWKFVFTVC